MGERTVLHHDDFRWRAEQVALQRKALRPRVAIAPPVLARTRDEEKPSVLGLLTFLYEYEDQGPKANPPISMPYARLLLAPNGAVLEWDELPQGRGGRDRPVGRMHSTALAELSWQERHAFSVLYYDALTGPDGPLLQHWADLTDETRRDLRDCLYTLLPPPFDALYQEHAGGYLSVILFVPRA